MFATLRIVAVPKHLRGYLSRFLVECGTGLYVGHVSPRVAEALWARAVEAATDGEVILITSDPSSEQGFNVRLHQTAGRNVMDFDGLKLIVSGDSDETTRKSNSEH